MDEFEKLSDKELFDQIEQEELRLQFFVLIECCKRLMKEKMDHDIAYKELINECKGMING